MKSILYICCFLMFYAFASGQEASATEVKKLLEESDRYIAEKNYEKAIEYCTKALDAGGDPVKIYTKRAVLNFVSQKHGAAIGDYTKLIELDPEKAAEHYYFRGLAAINVQSPLSTMCDDFLKSKELGYAGDWKSFTTICPRLWTRD